MDPEQGYGEGLRDAGDSPRALRAGHTVILLALTKKFDGEHEEMEDLMARTLEAQKLAEIACERRE